MLEKLRGRNLFLTTLLFEGLSASRAGGCFPRGDGEEVRQSLSGAAAGPCLAAEGVRAEGVGTNVRAEGVRAVLVTRDSVTALPARAQTTRGEHGDSSPLAVLCFPSLQVPHLQPWALHPRGFNGHVRFACFVHGPPLVGLMNSTEP